VVVFVAGWCSACAAFERDHASVAPRHLLANRLRLGQARRGRNIFARCGPIRSVQRRGSTSGADGTSGSHLGGPASKEFRGPAGPVSGPTGRKPGPPHGRSDGSLIPLSPKPPAASAACRFAIRTSATGAPPGFQFAVPVPALRASTRGRLDAGPGAVEAQRDGDLDATRSCTIGGEGAAAPTSKRWTRRVFARLRRARRKLELELQINEKIGGGFAGSWTLHQTAFQPDLRPDGRGSHKLRLESMADSARIRSTKVEPPGVSDSARIGRPGFLLEFPDAHRCSTT